MEIATQVEPSREGINRTREVERLVQDVRENVGDPSNLCRQRRSPEWYIGCMDLMIDLVETEPSSFK